MRDVDEDPNLTTDEMLDFLCWAIGKSGERFYPPDETAEECVDELCGDASHGEEYEYCRGVEHGQHGRAWTDAVEFYHYLDREGFDPVARAEREVERTVERQDLDGPDGLAVDWAWLDASGRVEVNDEA